MQGTVKESAFLLGEIEKNAKDYKELVGGIFEGVNELRNKMHCLFTISPLVQLGWEQVIVYLVVAQIGIMILHSLDICTSKQAFKMRIVSAVFCYLEQFLKNTLPLASLSDRFPIIRWDSFFSTSIRLLFILILISLSRQPQTRNDDDRTPAWFRKYKQESS